MKKHWFLLLTIAFAATFTVGCGDDGNRQVESDTTLSPEEQQAQYDDYDQQQADMNQNYD
ncbi:hypothetical protein [Allorhodopirellula solitaria]|uniref:Secreted protein n=1 Tax=Allorhodopirellula solitaria TaxID=2527987 RepID=A0A5C5YG68_9BACT|nr:hypothetical protein [Allorhodopirellula solitaria]TWT73365.1 hypothetical protein CA85_18350 [Allorhodopirellula solitaria]